MSVPARLLGWLDRRSDDVSPLVVKEVRQGVRGREFIVSFLASLAAGLVVAFLGATEALSGSSTAGRWTFAALMACLVFLGLAVVPLAAFSTLRNERMEQTFDLITVTSLSPRRIVVGKLLSQSVKLLTLFAAIAPFLTMSFLLGGIDLTTILISLLLIYMGSVWAGALCLFLSTVFKSRGASGFVFGAVGLLVIFLLLVGTRLFQMASRGFGVPSAFGFGPGTGPQIKEFAVFTTFWLTSLTNFVLLAENRLSLRTEDTVTPLRVGFVVQFLMMIFWAIAFMLTTHSPDTPRVLATAGSIHLAVVAMFVVTEDLAVPRRVLTRMRSSSGTRTLLVLFGPGAGRGAAYVLAQMVLLIVAVAICRATAPDVRALVAACGYICFYTGVPVMTFWRMAPAGVTTIKRRVAVLCTLAAVLVLPDVLHHLIFQPETIDFTYAFRHLINPIATVAKWEVVEGWDGWVAVPFLFGLVGLLSYVWLIRFGARATAEAAPLDPQAVPAGGEPGRGGVLY